MKRMSVKQWRSFLEKGTKTGKLATVRSDGSPHVAPVWFVLDGEQLVFMTSERSVKGKNLEREPRVMISIDDESFPFAFVTVEGRAQILRPGPDELLKWSTRIARRYVGEERADAFGKRNAVPEEMLVRVDIQKVIAASDIAG